MNSIHLIYKKTVSAMRALCLLIAVLSFVGIAKAQFPVQITPQLLSPYSLQLNSYTTGTTPKIIVTLTNADLQQPVINVRMRMTIKSQSVIIRSRDDAFYPNVALVAGVPARLSLNDLAPYFDLNNLEFSGFTKAQYQQLGRLPEGFYEFCFEAMESNTRAVVSRSECAIAAISLSEPPLLNLPMNKGAVLALDPLNLMFSWTPRHLSNPNAAFSTVYDFQIVEILDNAISPEVAFRNGQPLFQTTTNNSSLLYGVGRPLLLESKTYGWRVRVRNTNQNDNVDFFRNNGFSEIFIFKYQENCGTPTNLTATPNAFGEVDISCPPAAKSTKYTFSYRKKGDLNWAEAFSAVPSYRLYNLTPGEVYEYKIGNTCKTASNVFFSTISSFKAPVPPQNSNVVKGKINWVYKLSEETTDPTKAPLIVNQQLKDTTTLVRINNAEKSKQAFPLTGASIKIYANVLEGGKSVAKLMGVGTSIPTGEYKMEVNWEFSRNASSYDLEITHPSGLFNKIKRAITIVRNPTGISFGDETLIAQSLQFKPSVFVTNPIPNGAAFVDVLLKADLYEKYAFMKAGGLGSASTIRYNNEEFVALVSLSDGAAYKKLFFNGNENERYVVRVRYNDRPASFYPMNSITNTSDAKGTKQVLLANRNFLYKVTTIIEGQITHRNKARRDVRILFSVNPSDILSSTNRQTEFSAITDGLGKYRAIDLPPLKSGAVVRMAILDRGLRTQSFTDTVRIFTAHTNRKDINLENRVYSVTGRLVDQNGYSIANALVKVVGQSQQTKSSEQGFYLLKSYGAEPANLEIIVDGYVPRTITYRPLKNESKNLTAIEWKQSVENTKALANYMSANEMSEATADLLNIGAGSLTNRFSTYFSETDDVNEAIDMDQKTINLFKGFLSITLKLNENPVRAKVKIGTTIKEVINTDGKYVVALVKGRYNYTITAFEEDEQFVPIYGEADIYTNDTTAVTILATSAYKITGKVTDKTTGEGLDSTKVSLIGLPVSAKTNRKGEYTLFVPKTREVRFKVVRKNYNSVDSIIFLEASRVLDFELEKRPASLPEITTIAGFPVEIERIEAAAKDEYRIWGNLSVDSNGVFYNNPEENKLTFREIYVSVEEGADKATPLYDIQFEEATTQTNAFGFGMVEAIGFPQINMKGLKDSTGEVTYANTVIGAWKMQLQLSSINRVASVMPISLPDAWLESADPKMKEANSIRAQNGLPAFAYMYSAPDFKINALSEEQEYKLVFDGDEEEADSTVTASFLKVPLGRFMHLGINPDDATLDKDGVTLKGYLQLPKIVGAKLPDSGRVGIEKLVIDKDHVVSEVVFLVSETKPLIAKVQKIEAQLKKVMLFGLGSANVGIGFGGTVTLKKTTSTGDTLIINQLSLVKTDEGTTLTGDFAFDRNGISLKSLVFRTPGDNHVMLSYNFRKKTFVLEVSGVLSYEKNRSTTAPATDGGSESGLGSAFPIEIQLFKLESKDWSLFLAAKANIKINIKVASISVERLLVSVGTDMSLDQMNAYLKSEDGEAPSSVGSGDLEEQIDESKASWAIGIKGGIEYDIKEIKSGGIKASFLLGNIKDKIQVRLNEIEITIEHPAFKLEAKVKMAFSGNRQGFEAEAKFETLKTTFDATFKYYKISATGSNPAGHEVGASIKANTRIATGALFWHAIGGGFDFNTATKKYKVFLVGDVGLTGTPKEVSYVKNATISILFETKACGAVPVIEGSGTLNLRNEDWGYATLKLDFCRTLLMVTVNSTRQVIPGVNLNVSGVLVAMKRVVNNQTKGAFFLGVNGSLKSMSGLMSGNVFLALGIDYDNNNQNSPNEVKSMWNKVGNMVKDNNGTFLNGLYVSGSPQNVHNSGGFHVGMAGFDAFSFNYGFSASGSCELSYKFSNNQFAIKAAINANATASLSVFGIGLNARASARVNLNGGYNGQWYMNGKANMKLEMGNSWLARCNRVSVRWADCCCADIPYPCWCRRWWGGYPCGCWKKVCLKYPIFTFKVCKSLGASFDYTQRGGTKINFNLN